jgi:hypothetical protein
VSIVLLAPPVILNSFPALRTFLANLPPRPQQAQAGRQRPAAAAAAAAAAAMAMADAGDADGAAAAGAGAGDFYLHKRRRIRRSLFENMVRNIKSYLKIY